MKQSILKTKKYHIYPNGYVYEGTKMKLFLSVEEADFLRSVKSKDKKEYYIENPDKLAEKAKEYAIPEPKEPTLADVMREAGIHTHGDPVNFEKMPPECDHSWRALQYFIGINKAVFFCIRCLEIKTLPIPHDF